MARYRAALCEDDATARRFIHTRLNMAFQQSDFSVDIDPYDNGPALLHAVHSGANYDLFFLDIDMPHVNGLDLCKKLRHMGFDVPVVFISNKEEMVFQTFQVQPLYFLRKNRFLQELPQLISAIQNEFSRHSDIFVTIEELYSGKITTFNVKHLLYVEAKGKYCSFVTQTPGSSLLSDTRIQIRLSRVSELLEPYYFIQSHRSYIVNCRFIFAIQKDVLRLDNQQTIPLSRGRETAVKAQFMEYIRNGGV